MSGLVLKSEDRDAFLAAMKAMKKPALEHRRMNILLLLDDGIVPSVIARMLDLDERTVVEYRHLYETPGAAGIGRLGYKGCPDGLMRREETAALRVHMAEQMDITSQAVCDYVQKTFGHVNTPNAAPVPAKALRSVHISERPACRHGSENVKTVLEGDWAGRLGSWISIPAAEAGNDPGSPGQGAVGIGIVAVLCWFVVISVEEIKYNTFFSGEHGGRGQRAVSIACMGEL
jgi:hypothetical protein